jgi:hypothetical protein
VGSSLVFDSHDKPMYLIVAVNRPRQNIIIHAVCHHKMSGVFILGAVGTQYSSVTKVEIPLSESIRYRCSLSHVSACSVSCNSGKVSKVNQ